MDVDNVNFVSVDRPRDGTSADRFAELESLILPRIAKIRNCYPQVAVRGGVDKL